MSLPNHPIRSHQHIRGIVRPICFAALRLMMNSNLIGCSTGRSAGFAPFMNLVDIRSGAPVQIGKVRAVGHEPAGFDKFSSFDKSLGAGSLPQVLQSVFAENSSFRLDSIRTASARPLLRLEKRAQNPWDLVRLGIAALPSNAAAASSSSFNICCVAGSVEDARIAHVRVLERFPSKVLVVFR